VLDLMRQYFQAHLHESVQMLGWVPSERAVSRITGLTFSTCILALAVIVWTLGSTGAPSVTVTFRNWFSVHEYDFPLVLLADRLSLLFLGLTVVLCGLTGQFIASGFSALLLPAPPSCTSSHSDPRLRLLLAHSIFWRPVGGW
jgi:hypothetical protein